MAKLGNIFNKEEIKKEEQHPRRIIKWIHYSKLKENVEQYCPARDKEEIESLADLIQATGEVIENLSVSKLDTDEYKIIGTNIAKFKLWGENYICLKNLQASPILKMNNGK